MYSTANDKNVHKYRKVDLRSDTVSLPDDKMRKVMANAVVGDDVYGEDPTVNELETRTASLFGKAAALFVPSGTMGNLLAIMVHCSSRGLEAIGGDMSHIYLYEQGGAAQIAGVQLSTIKNNPDGTYDLIELQRKIRGFDIHEPITKLVLVENTHNMCGGKVLPLSWLRELSILCKENNLILHMDGARVFNAAAYLNVSVSEIAQHVDTLCCCLSKGLCCPVGSILVGSQEFITKARRFRKVLGGGMRQAGILAAAALYSFDNIVSTLSETHKKTYRIAQAIRDLNSQSFKVDIENLHTNILMVHVINSKWTSADFTKRLIEVRDDEITNNCVDENGKGIALIVSARDWAFCRLVLYTSVTDIEIELAIKKIKYVILEHDKCK